MFVCDGVNGERVRLVATPIARGMSQMWIYTKLNFSRDRETVRVGDEEPGAGQIVRELRGPDDGATGSIQSIDPPVLGSGDVIPLPTLSTTTARSEVTPCRRAPRGRVPFVDTRRTVLITAEPRDSHTYRSFDHGKRGAPVGSTSSVPTASHGRSTCRLATGYGVVRIQRRPLN